MGALSPEVSVTGTAGTKPHADHRYQLTLSHIVQKFVVCPICFPKPPTWITILLLYINLSLLFEKFAHQLT